MQDNPTILSNLNQYQSLPEFTKICREIDNSRWDHFCFQARTANELADLPDDVLFQLSLKTAMTMASDIKFLSVELTREILESVVERSWRAIQK